MDEATHDSDRTDQKNSASTDDAETLYKVNIRTAASPTEVTEFTELLEAHGYEVVTDLQRGKMEIRRPADAGPPLSLEERIDAVVEERLAEEARRTDAKVIDGSRSTTSGCASADPETWKVPVDADFATTGGGDA